MNDKLLIKKVHENSSTKSFTMKFLPETYRKLATKFTFSNKTLKFQNKNNMERIILILNFIGCSLNS